MDEKDGFLINKRIVQVRNTHSSGQDPVSEGVKEGENKEDLERETPEPRHKIEHVVPEA